LKNRIFPKDCSFSYSRKRFFEKIQFFENFSISKNNFNFVPKQPRYYDNLKTLEKLVLHENETKTGQPMTLLVRV
jgi:hypothetical protein